MEEVQRIVGESGEAVAIWREWELKDEAVNWLLSQKGYVQSAVTDADHGDEYVLLMPVLRDLESLRRACSAGNEEVVVPRSLVEQEEAEGGIGAACELLAFFCYIECPKGEQSRSDGRVDAEKDDLRYYYRIVGCKLGLSEAIDADSDAVEKQSVEGHRGSAEEGWKACRSFVMDSSRVRRADGQMNINGKMGDDTIVNQTPIIRLQLDAWARADEFHLDLKLQVRSLSVGVLKKEFQNTATCLGFFPDRICLSMEPCWVEEHMSEAIFENLHSTRRPPSKIRANRTTQNTEIGVTLGMEPVKLSAKTAWGDAQTTTQELDHDVSDVTIEYETEEGGVASIEWQMRRWGNGKPYRSDSWPLSPSWIFGKKLPKLPFKGTTPPLKDLAAVSWRLPIGALHNQPPELRVKIHVSFDMCFISLREASLFAKLPKTKNLRLQQEFGPFRFELPAALCASDAAPS